MKFILIEGAPKEYIKYLTIGEIYEGRKLPQTSSYSDYIVIKANDGQFRHYKEIYFKTLRDINLSKILDY